MLRGDWYAEVGFTMFCIWLTGQPYTVLQDVEFEVRSAMCQGLPHFVRALTGKAAAIDKVADELLVLLEDEEVRSWSACMRCDHGVLF